MSMNLKLRAKRVIIIERTGQRDWQYVDIPLYQTPTDVSYELINSKNVFEAYCNWVMSWSEDDYVEVFDFDCENPQYTTVNDGKDHIDCIHDAVNRLIDQGYEMEWYVQ